MTTARLTANSSVPHQQSASLNNPTEGITPFVQNTAPRITADLEGSGNGGLAQSLATNRPNVAKHMTPPTSSLVTKPVPADYPVPVLDTPPAQPQISLPFTAFCSEMEEINRRHMDITNSSGVQDSLLQAPQAMADEDYPCKKQHGG